MGIVNKVIPKYTKTSDGKIKVKQNVEPVYIDDIFDPFFNRKAKAYLTDKYGNPIIGTAAGMLELVNNSLIGQTKKWGILGPGMGILSTFGRSMDKADDFLLGTLTEGVNLFSNINPLAARQRVENPIQNILIEDEDYTGKKLLASMANNMSKLAGGATVTEEDLGGAWNIPSTAIELATDPGILGGSLAKHLAPSVRNLSSKEILHNLGKSGVKSAVGEVGQLLSNYDDLMARISIDIAAPGLRPLLKNFLTKIGDRILGVATSDKYKDMTLANPDNVIDTITETSSDSMSSPPVTNITIPDITNAKAEEVIESLKNVNIKDTSDLDMLEQMLKDVTKKYNITKTADPELYRLIAAERRKIYELKRGTTTSAMRRLTDANIQKQDQYLKEFLNTLEQENRKYNEQLTEALENTEIGKKFVPISKTNRMGYYDFYTQNKEEVEQIINELTDLKSPTLENLDLAYYRNKNFKTDDDMYKEIFNDLEYGFLKKQENDVTTFADDNIVNILSGRLKYLMNKKEYDPSLFKIYYSPTAKQSAIAPQAIKYVNSALSQVILDNPKLTAFSSFDTLIDTMKKDPEFEKIFDKLPQSDKRVFELSFSHLINPSFYKNGKQYNITGITYLKDVDRFTKWVQNNIAGTTLEYEPFYRSLIDFSDNIQKNIFDTLYNRTTESFDTISKNAKQYLENTDSVFKKLSKEELETFGFDSNISASTTIKNAPESMNILSTSVNPLIRENQKLFLKENGELDLDKFSDFYYALPSYDIKLSPRAYARVFTPTAETDKMFDIAINNLKNGKPAYYGIKNKQSNAYKSIVAAVGYVDDTKINAKIKELEQKVISTESLFTEEGLKSLDDWAKIIDMVRERNAAIIAKLEQNKKGIVYGQDLIRFLNPKSAIDKVITVVKNKGNLTNPVQKISEDTLSYIEKLKGDLASQNSVLKLAKQNSEENRIFTLKQEIARTKETIERLENSIKPVTQTPSQYLIPLELQSALSYNVKKAIASSIGYKNFEDWKTLKLKDVNQFAETSEENITKIVNKLENLKNMNFSTVKDRAKLEKVSENIGFDEALKIVHREMSDLKSPKRIASIQKNFTDVVKKTIDTYPDAQLAKEVFSSPSLQQSSYTTIKQQLCPSLANTTYFSSDFDTVMRMGTPREKTIYTLISEAESIVPNIYEGDVPLLKTQRVQYLFKQAQSLMNNGKEVVEGKFTPEQISQYFNLKDKQNNFITPKGNFLEDLIASNGHKFIIVDPSQSSTAELIQQIQKNASLINNGGKKKIIKPVIKPLENTKFQIVGYTLDTSNKAILKDIKKLRIPKDLVDVVWSTAKELTPEEMTMLQKFQPLENLFNSMQDVTQELSKELGFNSVYDNYFKHVMSDNVEGADWLKKNIYDDVDLDDLEYISANIQNSLKSIGVLGTTYPSRSLMGVYGRYNAFAPIFSNDLNAIVKSTFSEGVFNNKRYQTFVELFKNDNFKISEFARTTDDLKRLLHVKENEKFTGNMTNMLLVAPKYKDGVLSSFIRFDKYSEKGLQQALQNPETILIPTHVLAPLDKIIKKDIKMSNKVYAFINRYLVLPFKFGTLANPGFLAGNVSDAYLKQALSLSKKYGTSLSEELANVAISLRNVMITNNQFADIYEKYIQQLELLGKEVPPTHKIPSLLIENTAARKNFIEWLNSKDSLILTTAERKKVQLWLYLNNFQNSSVFKKNYMDLEDVADLAHTSEFDIPTNFVERILMGKGEYSPKDITTWGLFMNNPISSTVMQYSQAIETYMRSAAILNDLMHTYKSSDIIDILELNGKEYAENLKNLKVKTSEAINLMNESNFDYENITGFMNAAGTIIPFPTFFLKNLGYWLEVLVDNPQFIDNAISMQEELWGNRKEETETDEFQAEAKGRGAIPLEFGQILSKYFKGIYKPTPLNSMFGAFNLLNDPLPNLAYRLNPALSFLTHHLQDKEDVKYRPYSTNPYEKNVKKTDSDFNLLKYVFHRLNPYERAINTGLRTPSKVLKGQAQLSDFVPSLIQPDFSTDKNKKKKNKK